MTKRLNPQAEILQKVIKKNIHFPNSELPVLIYHKALKLPSQKNKSSVIIRKIFARNGWSNAWRNGIYEFHHYHSNTHECMGIAMGNATVILGGPKGRKIKLVKGDVIILPAGVGHKCLNHSDDFQCVGAYPQGKDYDIHFGTLKELKKTLPNIKKLNKPAKDPVFGKEGFLKSFWTKDK
jgi:uncharacterized protein YjlB